MPLEHLANIEDEEKLFPDVVDFFYNGNLKSSYKVCYLKFFQYLSSEKLKSHKFDLPSRGKNKCRSFSFTLLFYPLVRSTNIISCNYYSIICSHYLPPPDGKAER